MFRLPILSGLENMQEQKQNLKNCIAFSDFTLNSMNTKDIAYHMKNTKNSKRSALKQKKSLS